MIKPHSRFYKIRVWLGFAAFVAAVPQASEAKLDALASPVPTSDQASCFSTPPGVLDPQVEGALVQLADYVPGSGNGSVTCVGGKLRFTDLLNEADVKNASLSCLKKENPKTRCQRGSFKAFDFDMPHEGVAPDPLSSILGHALAPGVSAPDPQLSDFFVDHFQRLQARGVFSETEFGTDNLAWRGSSKLDADQIRSMDFETLLVPIIYEPYYRQLATDQDRAAAVIHLMLREISRDPSIYKLGPLLTRAQIERLTFLLTTNPVSPEISKYFNMDAAGELGPYLTGLSQAASQLDHSLSEGKIAAKEVQSFYGQIQQFKKMYQGCDGQQAMTFRLAYDIDGDVIGNWLGISAQIATLQERLQSSAGTRGKLSPALKRLISTNSASVARFKGMLDKEAYSAYIRSHEDEGTDQRIGAKIVEGSQSSRKKANQVVCQILDQMVAAAPNRATSAGAPSAALFGAVDDAQVRKILAYHPPGESCDAEE